LAADVAKAAIEEASLRARSRDARIIALQEERLSLLERQSLLALSPEPIFCPNRPIGSGAHTLPDLEDASPSNASSDRPRRTLSSQEVGETSTLRSPLPHELPLSLPGSSSAKGPTSRPPRPAFTRRARRLASRRGAIA